MKMKWKQVFYSLAIGVGITMAMTACSENDNRDVVNPTDDDLEDAYFSFATNMQSSAGVRAYTGTEDGSPEEDKVSRVRMVLYDAATNIANYAFEYSGTALHSSSTAQDFQGTCMLIPASADAPASYVTPSAKNFMPLAMKVKLKPYNLLVLINPNADIIAQTRASKEFINVNPLTGAGTENLTNVSNSTVFRSKTGAAPNNDLTAFIGAANIGNAPSEFLMSNFQEYVAVSEAALQTTAAKAYANPVAVKVDRAVAKVGMAYGPSLAANSNGIVSGGTWKLDITNKSGYWMRHMTKALKNATETSATPRENFYAEDPNFDLYSWERWAGLTAPGGMNTADPTAVKSHFNYITNADVTTLISTTPYAYSYEYTLENTMEAAEQYEDVTTAAILKIKYLPYKTSLDATLGTGSYYVWKGYVFTAAELVAIRSYDPAVSSNPAYDTFLTLRQYLLDNEPALTAAFGAGFGAPGYNSKQEGELAYNADGVNYYRVLIRHFDDDQENEKMAYGRYGVVRNTQYRLTLNSINAPGSIDIPDPKGPDDKEMLLGVSIEVLPWLLRTQTVDID